MTENWKKFIKACDRRFRSHDVAYFQAREAKLLSELDQARSKRMCKPTAKAGRIGVAIDGIVDDLLAHELCKNLRGCRPEIVIHFDPTARLGTFGNVIVIPLHLIPNLAVLEHVAALRGALAHEVAHMLFQDAAPEVRGRSSIPSSANQRMERRADLVAAHLSGDGGLGLAHWLESRAREEESLVAARVHTTRWVDRIADELTSMIDRTYPATNDRVAYLKHWAELHARGERLPAVDLVELERLNAIMTNRCTHGDPGRTS